MQTESILKSQKSLLESSKTSQDKQSKMEQSKLEELEEQQNTEFSLYFLIFVFALTFIIIFIFHLFSSNPEVIIPQIVFFRPMKFFFSNYYQITSSGAKIMVLNSQDESLKQSYFSLTLGVGKSSDGNIYGLSQMIADQLINHQYINYSQNSEIFWNTLKENDGEINYVIKDYTTNYFIKCSTDAFQLILEAFFNLISEVTFITKTKNLKKYLVTKFGQSEINTDQFEKNLESSVITLLKIIHNPDSYIFENGLKSKLNENLVGQIKQAIKKYFKENYLSNLMTITVISNIEYKNMFNFLKNQIEKFPSQPYKNRPFFYNSLQYIIEPSFMGKIHLINSHINENLLFLNFQLPYIIDNNKSFIPMELFLIIININAENSFLKRLDVTDLTYNHKISVTHDDSSHCLLQIRLHLRNDAYNYMDKIIILFYEFINNLQKSHMEEHYSFLENISQYNTFFGLDSDIYKFQQAPLNNSQHVQFFSKKLQVYDPEQIFRQLNLGNFMKSSWTQFLNSFTLSNLSVVFLSEEVKTRDFRILESQNIQEDLDNNLLYDFNYRTSKKFQNELKINNMKIQKQKEQQRDKHKEQEEIILNELQRKKESQLNGNFQKTKLKFEEDNKQIFHNLINKYIAIRPIQEYENRKFFIYQFKIQYRQIFQRVIERSQMNFTNFLPYDQQQLLKYSLITACQVPKEISYHQNNIYLKKKSIFNVKYKNNRIEQNIKTIDTRKVLKIAESGSHQKKENISYEYQQFLFFKKCLLREFALDTKTIIPTNLIKDNFLRVYFKQYRNTYQSKQVLNIEIISTSIFEYLQQKLEEDENQTVHKDYMPDIYSFVLKKNSQFLQAKITLDLFCQYFVQYIFKNFVKEFVLGNSLDCEFYGTILTLKMETFEQQGVIYSKKVLQELKNFNTVEKFDITTLNDIKYQYIAQITQAPSELEPLTEYIFDKNIDQTKFNIFYQESIKQIENMVISVGIDDLISIQKLLFVDLEVSLLYTGNVNAVQTVNESKHYIKYFFEENSNYQSQLVPRQTQLPLILKSFGDRTQLFRICLGSKIQKNIYKTIFMVGMVSNKQYIALSLTVDYLSSYLKKNKKKMKNVDSFNVKIKDYYGQFGILIHFEGDKLKPHMFEYVIENLLDQFQYFIQKINNFDLKKKAESTYKKIIAISGTLKTVNNKILQLYRQSTLSMSEMTFQDSFKSFNKGFLMSFLKQIFYKNQKRMIVEFYKQKITDRIKAYKVDKNFMLNTQDVDIKTQQYKTCYIDNEDKEDKEGDKKRL